MSIVLMIALMLTPVTPPIIGELCGRLNDRFGFFGRQHRESAGG